MAQPTGGPGPGMVLSSTGGCPLTTPADQLIGGRFCHVHGSLGALLPPALCFGVGSAPPVLVGLLKILWGPKNISSSRRVDRSDQSWPQVLQGGQQQVQLAPQDPLLQPPPPQTLPMGLEWLFSLSQPLREQLVHLQGCGGEEHAPCPLSNSCGLNPGTASTAPIHPHRGRDKKEHASPPFHAQLGAPSPLKLLPTDIHMQPAGDSLSVVGAIGNFSNAPWLEGVICCSPNACIPSYCYIF